MSENLTIELIRAAPAAFWVLFALVVYLTLRPVIRRKLDNLATVRTQGVEMSFAAALLGPRPTRLRMPMSNLGRSPPSPQSTRRPTLSVAAGYRGWNMRPGTSQDVEFCGWTIGTAGMLLLPHCSEASGSPSTRRRPRMRPLRC